MADETFRHLASLPETRACLSLSPACQARAERGSMMQRSHKDENDKLAFFEWSIPWQMEQHQDLMAYSTS